MRRRQDLPPPVVTDLPVVRIQLTFPSKGRITERLSSLLRNTGVQLVSVYFRQSAQILTREDRAALTDEGNRYDCSTCP